MHKFLSIELDAYIDNHPDFKSKNLGYDEILEVGSESYLVRSFLSTSSLKETNTDYIGLALLKFNGSVTGSVTGSANYIEGSLTGSSMFTDEEEHC